MRLYLPNGMLKRADCDVSDLTASKRSGECHWAKDAVDVLECPMTPEPSAAEQVAIRRRMVTVDAADEARLYELLASRDTAASTFERLWIDTELARYGE